MIRPSKLAAVVRWLATTLCAAVALGAAGCAQLGHRDAIAELSQFDALAGLEQVRYAEGAEPFARMVAAVLPQAAAQVEAAHQRAFRAPPVVYVCGTEECFHRFVHPRWNFTAAVVYDNRLVLSPRLFGRERERLVPVLLHELSHLHLGQWRGHYSMEIPVWFHEGLASFVAHGGGADLVSDAQAWAAVAQQRHFLPDEQHLPWQRHMADHWQLPVSVFYRQALLFVRSLAQRDPRALGQLLRALENGMAFDVAFAQAYQANPAHAARAFFASGPSPAHVTTAAACASGPHCCQAASPGERHAQQ